MANVYIEPRPKGRPEGSHIDDYVVEDHADHVLATFKTQQEAIDWARKNMSPAFAISTTRKNPITGVRHSKLFRPGERCTSPMSFPLLARQFRSKPEPRRSRLLVPRQTRAAGSGGAAPRALREFHVGERFLLRRFSLHSLPREYHTRWKKN
jgi:hypothetical protein